MRVRTWLLGEHRWMCLLIATVLAIVFARFCAQLVGEHAWMGAGDFEVYFDGARQLLYGHNPWRNPAFGSGHSYPWSEPLYYPLPTLLLLVPLVWLPATRAIVLFVAFSSWLLAYAVLRSNPRRLPLFASPAFLVAVNLGQWTPLALASLLLPGLSALYWLKPSYGAMAFMAKPRLKGALIFMLVGLLGLILVPSWPLDWLRALSENHHPVPLTVTGGPLLLLAGLCWRRSEARLLLGLALIPHLVFWYDGVLCWYVARTWRQNLFLSATSWAAFILWYRAGSGVRSVDGTVRIYVMAGIYLPALGILLWQERAALAALSRRLPLLVSYRGSVPIRRATARTAPATHDATSIRR